MRRLQDLHRADDGGQHVVEVVRDAAGELADRLHLLRMAQRLLGLAQGGLRLALGGDVAADRLQEIVRRHGAPCDAPAAAVAGPHVELDQLGRACRATVRRARTRRIARPPRRRRSRGRWRRQQIGSFQPSRCVQAGLIELIVPSRPATIMTSVDSVHMRLRSAVLCGDALLQRLVESAQRVDRHAALVDVAQDGGDEDAALALPARGRHLEIARRTVLAAGRELDRAGRDSRRGGCPRRPCSIPSASSSRSAIDCPISSSARVAELARRRRIGQLDHALRHRASGSHRGRCRPPRHSGRSGARAGCVRVPPRR